MVLTVLLLGAWPCMVFFKSAFPPSYIVQMFLRAAAEGDVSASSFLEVILDFH